MLVTGLYLWWPRERRGIAGVLYPRLRAGRRVFWRDLHAVTGIWVSTFALFLLITALPWTTVWGAGFNELRALARPPTRQDWSAGRADEHAEHLRDMRAAGATLHSRVALDDIVERVSALGLDPPVRVYLPNERPAVLARAQRDPEPAARARARAGPAHRRGAARTWLRREVR